MPKILILRFSSIGDIVLTTPVIRTLKNQLGSAEVHYCTKPQFSTILTNNPYVDKVICLDGGIAELIKRLRKEKYDYIVDLHNNLRTRIIKFALGVRAFTFDKINFEKWLMVNFKINKLPHVHIVDRYLKTVGSLGIKNDELGLDYFIPEKDEVEEQWLPLTHREGYIAFAIGAQHATKRLPLHKMIELCERINKPIILLGGKDDADTGEKIISHFNQPLLEKKFIYNACGKYNLNQSASVLKNSILVFSHDTGLMHIASAFKKEIYSIWGNTIPMLGMYPYKTSFTIIENNNLTCRPCSKIGYQKCPEGHFKCMNDLVFDFYIP